MKLNESLILSQLDLFYSCQTIDIHENVKMYGTKSTLKIIQIKCKNKA